MVGRGAAPDRVSAQVGRSGGARTPGLAYVPLGALLTLSVAATATAGAIALDGLPDGALGLIFVLLGLLGIRPDSMVVASAAWLLAARISLLVLVGTVIGLFVAGRRNAP